MSEGEPEVKDYKPNSVREAKTAICATEPILYESERNGNQSITLASKVAAGVEGAVSVGAGDIETRLFTSHYESIAEPS